MTMAKKSQLDSYTAPILVLSLGESGCGDEAFGPALLQELTQRYRYAGGFVEFVNGGSEGVELLRCFAGRHIVVVLDALSAGREPGTVATLEDAEVLRYVNGNSDIAHPGDVHELLSTAAFLGELPQHFYVVGVQPSDLHQGNVLSSEVGSALQSATIQAQEIIDRWLVELSEPMYA
jgi:hydrogenase maturation protease